MLRSLMPLLAAIALVALAALTQAHAAETFPSVLVPALGVVITAGKSPKELLEIRGSLLEDAKKVINKADEEKRDLTDEENAKVDEMFDDADECKRVVDEDAKRAEAIANRRKRLEEAEEEMRAHGVDLNRVRGSAVNPEQPGQNPAPTVEDHAKAIQGWFINQSDRSDLTLTDEHREAADKVGLRLNARDLVLNLDYDFENRRHTITNAMQTTSGTSGGYLRPQGFNNSIEAAMLWFGGMLQVADVMRTPNANPFAWPTANDTTNEGVQIGESKQVSTQDPTFAQVWLYAYKFSSKEILVSHELLRDTPFRLESIIGNMLGERLGRVLNKKCTNGTGAGTPHGIVPAATVGKTAASATAVTSDELLDLMHAVDKAYRDQPGVGWMFHDNVALALRKLKDSNGRYHWVDGMDAGQPNTLFRKPVTINNDMASSIASEAKTILFGQLTKYKIRQVGTVRLRRLTERHAENDQEAFLAFNEFDGKLLDAGGDPIQVLQQAA